MSETNDFEKDYGSGGWPALEVAQADLIEQQDFSQIGLIYKNDIQEVETLKMQAYAFQSFFILQANVRKTKYVQIPLVLTEASGSYLH